MQWDRTPSAGFTAGEPWIAVNPNYTEINAADQLGDPDSVLAHFKAVIALRHSDPVVAHGDFDMLLPEDPRVYAFTRSWEGSTLLVLGNFSSSAARAAVPGEARWAAAELVLANYPAVSGDTITLRPWETRIHRQRGSDQAETRTIVG